MGLAARSRPAGCAPLARAARTCAAARPQIRAAPPARRARQFTSTEADALCTPRRSGGAGGRRAVLARAGPEPPARPGPNDDTAAIYYIALGVTAVVLLVLRFAGEAIDDADAWAGVGGFGAGDVAGAALWSVSVYYCSPIQLLYLFLGKIDTERPSDWVLQKLGQAARLDVDAVDYAAPLPLRAAMLAIIAATGVSVSWAFQALLGDATWGVSTGIGACVAASVYEVGRPDRLSVEEAQALEAQWQDFARFADAALARSGRCHETEVFRAFRRAYGRYRSEEALSDARLRDMVRNWWGGAERSRAGWYKNLSLKSASAAAAARPASNLAPPLAAADDAAG